jgi:hypothetical protein
MMFTDKRGIFQKASLTSDTSALSEVAQFKTESFAEGGSPTMFKVYITSPNVIDESWTTAEKAMKAWLAHVENED